MRIFGIINNLSLQLKNSIFVRRNLKTCLIRISSRLLWMLISTCSSSRPRGSSNVWLEIRGVRTLILFESWRRHKILFVRWLIFGNKNWSSFQGALLFHTLIKLLIKFFDFNSGWFSSQLVRILDIKLFKALRNLLKVLVLPRKRLNRLRWIIRNRHLPIHGLWDIYLWINLYRCIKRIWPCKRCNRDLILRLGDKRHRNSSVLLLLDLTSLMRQQVLSNIRIKVETNFLVWYGR